MMKNKNDEDDLNLESYLDYLEDDLEDDLIKVDYREKGVNSFGWIYDEEEDW